MSTLTPRGIPVVLDGVERHFLFTLNVIDQIQDEFNKTVMEVFEDITGSDAQSRDEKRSRHTLKHLTVLLLNDEARRAGRNGDDSLAMFTDESIGDIIGMDNFWTIAVAIMKAYGLSMPEAEDEDPNKRSGQQSS